MSTSNLDSPKKTNNNNNNDLISKLAVLRNVIIDERKKREEIEKKLSKLEEENKLFQKENEDIKVDNTMKGELIEKLKLELRTYRNKNNEKGVKKFFSNLFEEEQVHADEKQEKEIKEDQINYLKKENEDLKNKISILEIEKETINNKLNEQIGEFDKLKKEYDNKITEVKNNYINKISNYEKEINEKINLVKEFSERNQYFTNYTKTFDSQKSNFENEISKLKNELKESKELNNNKDKIISDLGKDQQNLLIQIDEANKEKEDFKMLINQYKLLIQELTPLKIDHNFIGYILPQYEDEKRKRIECSFGKVLGGFCVKIENKEEVILNKNDIKDMIIDKKYNDRIKIIFADDKEIICQFSSKEVKFFKSFYYELKNRPNIVEKALMKISFGDFLY